MPNQPIQIDFQHIKRLTSHVGIIQHANFHIPNPHHGYCLDDNARALQLMIISNKCYPKFTCDSLIETYLSYIIYMQKSDGNFHNFLSYSMDFLDDECTPDAYGRTIMALGATLKYDTSQKYKMIVQQIFYKAIPHARKLVSIRAVAYTLVGMIWFYQTSHEKHYLDNYILPLAEYIAEEYSLCSTNEWNWFEEIISYDNAIIPYALLLTFDITQNKKYKDIGCISALFLDKLLFENKYLRLIGNDGWYCKGDLNNVDGQQPIEIPSLLLLYGICKKLNLTEKFRGTTHDCYNWYFGINSERLVLFDENTKGCRDGLEHQAVNYNQGAESTICFWQSFIYYNNCL